MTTIAYNHKDKEIAVDGRATSNNLIISDNDVKWIEREGQLFLATSTGDDWRSLIDVYFGSEPAKQDYDCTVMLTCNGVVFLMTYRDGNLSQWAVNEDTAIGSGESFALAAMDFGRSARSAVKYAMTRDTKTGGKVRVFKVK